MLAIERHRIERLPESVQNIHHRLLTDHLAGLVGRAEGRGLEPRGLETVSSAERLAPAVERPAQSPVAARLRAFGGDGVDPRTVIR